MASAIGHAKEIQHEKFRKGDIQLSLFTDDINVHVEDDEELTNTFL